MAPASLGRTRAGTFRSGGTALATASRTIRRCTPSFRATPLIVPAPCSYSRRISSYSSTLFLLGKTTSVFSFSCRKQSTGFAFQGGPNQTIEVGQFRLAKSLPSQGEAEHRGGDSADGLAR